jgi:hypothetical protein
MHWFCGVDGADGSELGHGAHYCCADCGNKKNGVSSTKHNCKGGMGTVDKRKMSSRKQQPQVVSAKKPSSGSNEHGVGKGQGGAQNNLSKRPPVSSDDSNGTSDVSSVDSPPKKRAKKQGISSSGTVNGRVLVINIRRKIQRLQRQGVVLLMEGALVINLRRKIQSQQRQGAVVPMEGVLEIFKRV